MAKISIIVPVYNVEQYLPKCLDSLIHQSYRDLEIICVNDDSPDHSSQILDKYAREDRRIKVITQNNTGLSGARNTGIKYVTGDYVMFVDSDDWIDLETCERAVRAIQETKADLVFWSYVREFQDASKDRIFPWEDGEIFEGDRFRKEIHRRQCGLIGEELSRPETGDSLVTAWGKLYSAEKLRASMATFVDTKLIGTEDALFNLHALGHFERAVYIKRTFYHYRKTNSTSLTKGYKKQLPEQWGRLFDMMREYVEENDLPLEYGQALQNRISLSIIGLGLNVLAAPCSQKHKLKMIRDIISTQRYRRAISTLELKYFPIHWKLFFVCARYKNSVCLYMLLNAIKKCIG